MAQVLWYNVVMRRFLPLLKALLLSAFIVAGVAYMHPPLAGYLLGNILGDPERFLALQKKADFDRNYKINFQDFTVFAAAYGQNS